MLSTVVVSTLGLPTIAFATTSAELLTAAEVTALVENPSKTILVLGDSISAGYGIQSKDGWVALLNLTLQSQESEWQAVNASVSGETTSGGLARLPRLLKKHKPAIVLIELGGNDGLRGYPISKMQENLNSIVELSKAAKAAPIVMAMRIPPNYGPRYTNSFEQAFITTTTDHDIPLIPFFLNEVALSPDMMQADGIHPTKEAQPQMRDTVLPHLAPLLD